MKSGAMSRGAGREEGREEIWRRGLVVVSREGDGVMGCGGDGVEGWLTWVCVGCCVGLDWRDGAFHCGSERPRDGGDGSAGGEGGSRHAKEGEC